MSPFSSTTIAGPAGSGLTVNAVAPGFKSFDEFAATAAAEIPVARVGQPADVATAVALFAGHESSFVSGQVLYVAGGPKT
jgi:3-oxoacyl-[acyl-carrier protein] reductase